MSHPHTIRTINGIQGTSVTSTHTLVDFLGAGKYSEAGTRLIMQTEALATQLEDTPGDFPQSQRILRAITRGIKQAALPNLEKATLYSHLLKLVPAFVSPSNDPIANGNIQARVTKSLADEIIEAKLGDLNIIFIEIILFEIVLKMDSEGWEQNIEETAESLLNWEMRPADVESVKLLREDFQRKKGKQTAARRQEAAKAEAEKNLRVFAQEATAAKIKQFERGLKKLRQLGKDEIYQRATLERAKERRGYRAAHDMLRFFKYHFIYKTFVLDEEMLAEYPWLQNPCRVLEHSLIKALSLDGEQASETRYVLLGYITDYITRYLGDPTLSDDVLYTLSDLKRETQAARKTCGEEIISNA